jgi:hypothetical protein
MVRTGKTYAKYRWSGRFFGRRVNCEYVPVLPARVVQLFLDDLRNIPYLLVWRSPQNGTVLEMVRMAREISRVDPAAWTGWIEIKRPDVGCTYVRTVERSLPQNGGRMQLIVCPGCWATRRSLYGWRPGGTHTTSAERAPLWECRKCLGLRYSSEGGALNHHPRAATAQLIRLLFAPLTSDSPKPWYPCVVTAPQRAWVYCPKSCYPLRPSHH